MDEYAADIKFGQWLRGVREKAGVTLLDAARLAGITADRLRELEMGYSERGITNTEARALGRAYQLPPEKLVEQALCDE